MNKEIWKDMLNYEGLYQVSNLGRIKNHAKVIKVYKTKRGYLRVFLCNNGKRICKQVHRLIALAFIPNPENLPTINHIDEDKANNNISNLEWMTVGDNVRHSVNNSGKGKGEKNSHSKYTEVFINQIRETHNRYPNLKYKDIANIYDISKSTIGHICRHDSWNHI